MTQFRPFSRSKGERQRPEKRRAGRHHDGAEAQKASLLDRVRVCRGPAARPQAKSTIMIAFFFTMPMSSKTPIAAITVNWVLKSHKASAAPTLAENSVDKS